MLIFQLGLRFGFPGDLQHLVLCYNGFRQIHRAIVGLIWVVQDASDHFINLSHPSGTESMVPFTDQRSRMVLEVEQRWSLEDEIQESSACQDRVGQSARFGFVDKILLNAGYGRKKGRVFSSRLVVQDPTMEYTA